MVVSDASVSGKGEHKIVDYVRRWRGSAAYEVSFSSKEISFEEKEISFEEKETSFEEKETS